jgi:hypothetical protein
MISNPVASELLPKARTRQCRFPTINRGRETALPCPLYHSGATGIDMNGQDTRSTTHKFCATTHKIYCGLDRFPVSEIISDLGKKF